MSTTFPSNAGLTLASVAKNTPQSAVYPAGAFVDLDGWGTFNMADVAKLGIRPVLDRFVVELLESRDGSVLFFQLVSIPRDLFRSLRVLRL